MLGKQWHNIVEINDAVSIDIILHILNDNRPHIVLTGAGAYNLLEHTVRCASAKAGIPCIAILDYWTNYLERFRRLENKQWNYSFPDRICVLDEIVRNEMLAEGFAREQIVVTGQPYFEYISNWKKTLSIEDVKHFRSRFVNDEGRILIGFFSEPIAEDKNVMHSNDIGYTQYDTITEVVRILGKSVKSDRSIHLVVRPHPREDEEKLKEILFHEQISPLFTREVSKIGSSLEFVVSCDLIIGMTSMALIEACIMAQPVLSIQLNLKKPDKFFGTTRGYCTSIYNDKELSNRLEQWFMNCKPRSGDAMQNTCNATPYMCGASEHIIAVMKELVETRRVNESIMKS